MNPLSQLKLWALVNFIDSVEASKIVDMLEDFAHKYFGDKWKDSMRALQYKLADVVVQIQRRVQ